MFVLNVDLWSADGTREVNLVRSSAASPQISDTSACDQLESATPAYSMMQNQPSSGRDQRFETGAPYGQAAYQTFPGPPQVGTYPQNPSPQNAAVYGQPYGGYNASTGAYPPQQGYQGQMYTYNGGQYKNDYSPATESLPSAHSVTSYGGRPFTPIDLNVPRMPINTAQPTGMFTRNLIGSLAASAFRLTDPDNRIGIWFVLQDLSVRTEGSFRYVSYNLRWRYLLTGKPALLFRECCCPRGRQIQSISSACTS